MSESVLHHALVRLSAEIVSAHVGRNTVAMDVLPDLIRTVYAALRQVGASEQPIVPQEPAVPIRKSVFPSYIVCLEDGKKVKMLKRHLHTCYGLTPQQYRAKWDLPVTYPMVAPDYAARRSKLAKQIGLGRKAAAAAVAEVEVKKIPIGTKGRKPKARKPAAGLGAAEA